MTPATSQSGGGSNVVVTDTQSAERNGRELTRDSNTVFPAAPSQLSRLQRNRSSSEPGGAIQPLNSVSVSGSFRRPRAHIRQDFRRARWQQCQGQQGSRFRQPDSTNNH